MNSSWSSCQYNLFFLCPWKPVAGIESMQHNELCAAAAAADTTLNGIRFFKFSTANIHIVWRKWKEIRIQDAVALGIYGLIPLLNVHVSGWSRKNFDFSVWDVHTQRMESNFCRLSLILCRTAFDTKCSVQCKDLFCSGFSDSIYIISGVERVRRRVRSSVSATPLLFHCILWKVTLTIIPALKVKLIWGQLTFFQNLHLVNNELGQYTRFIEYSSSYLVFPKTFWICRFWPFLHIFFFCFDENCF